MNEKPTDAAGAEVEISTDEFLLRLRNSPIEEDAGIQAFLDRLRSAPSDASSAVPFDEKFGMAAMARWRIGELSPFEAMAVLNSIIDYYNRKEGVGVDCTQQVMRIYKLSPTGRTFSDFMDELSNSASRVSRRRQRPDFDPIASSTVSHIGCGCHRSVGDALSRTSCWGFGLGKRR